LLLAFIGTLQGEVQRDSRSDGGITSIEAAEKRRLKRLLAHEGVLSYNAAKVNAKQVETHTAYIAWQATRIGTNATREGGTFAYTPP
jgi:hypothetical protein